MSIGSFISLRIRRIVLYFNIPPLCFIILLSSWHDSDNNGYIETNELPDFLRAAGFNPVQPSLEMWCSHLDSNNEGKARNQLCTLLLEKSYNLMNYIHIRSSNLSVSLERH